MAINPASLGLTFDLAGVAVAEKSQVWILSAMHSHGPTLVTLLWRILGNEDDVCDAYQETFLRLAHLPQKQKPVNLRAYLFRTASNVAVSMLRRRQIERKYQQTLFKKTSSSFSDPAGFMDTMDLQQHLRDAIARLPEYLSNVVVLRDLVELPYPQVAKILGITTAAARVYRHKAIKLLAVWMSKSNNRGAL
jgi:RNA polymerase sigma factor (sigma-70 family)